MKNIDMIIVMAALLGVLLLSTNTELTVSKLPQTGNILQTQEKREKQYSIVVYAATWCPACHEALELLDSKKIKYTVYFIDKDKERRAEMYEKTGLPNIPQIFVNGKYIGGLGALKTLVTTGAFD